MLFDTSCTSEFRVQTRKLLRGYIASITYSNGLSRKIFPLDVSYIRDLFQGSASLFNYEDYIMRGTDIGII